LAVTGESIEDSTLLKQVHIAIASWKNREIIKQAANIIILNNNIDSIFLIIIFGRNLYAYIRKYFQIVITMSIVVLFLTLVNNIQSLGTLWLSATQVLFLSIFIDELSAYLISYEKPVRLLQSSRKVTMREQIITEEM